MPFDLPSLSFWIRWIHVVSMALVLGSAIFLWGVSLGIRMHEERQPMRTLLLVRRL